VLVGDGVERVADALRPWLALYIGGMGARGANFHFDVFARMGFETEARKVQDLYLEGRKQDAAAAVPTAMVEKVALVGPKEKIRDDLAAWQESIATTLLVSGSRSTLQMMAELLL
jgi:alkanesulfonate monooxygenase SsuD/methylene tetrahydromethanopterin reductase-like flavin-dependent oxidoreductase (luciferase family)